MEIIALLLALPLTLLIYFSPIIITGIILFRIISPYYKYIKSNYSTANTNGFFKTIRDKGLYGEYITFTYLEKLDINKKIMANLHLPKEDGTTTEIDLIMLSEYGIYVFESKNYSGWIFGSEKSKKWTQTFRNGKRYHFLNPIWQNQGHISELKSVIGSEKPGLYKSLIIFSEGCKLKKVNMESTDIRVIKRDELIKTIKEDVSNSQKLLSSEEIEEIYNKLKEFTNVDEETKTTHIKNIKE